MDKIRYGIIGFGAQGSSYVNILTGTPAFPASPPPLSPLTASWALSATLIPPSARPLLPSSPMSPSSLTTRK